MDRGSGLLCGVVIGVRLCLPSGLAAGVGMGVVEADACFSRGSGLGVRAVSARSRAARARASGDEGSEERRERYRWMLTITALTNSLLLTVPQDSVPGPFLFCGVSVLVYFVEYLKALSWIPFSFVEYLKAPAQALFSFI